MNRERDLLEEYGLLLRLKMHQSKSEFAFCPKDEFLRQVSEAMRKETLSLDY